MTEEEEDQYQLTQYFDNFGFNSAKRQKQQSSLFLQKQFTLLNNITSKNSIQIANYPNEKEIIIRKMYEKYIVLMTKLKQLRSFCQQYKCSLPKNKNKDEYNRYNGGFINKNRNNIFDDNDIDIPQNNNKNTQEYDTQDITNKMIINNNNDILQTIGYIKKQQENLNYKNNNLYNKQQKFQENQINPLIIQPIIRIASKQNHQILKIINKLKIMICKVKNYQSSQFQYYHQTYIDKLKQFHGELHLDFKINNNMKIGKMILKIKKKFKIISAQMLHYEKLRPSQYISQLHLIPENPLFYVDLNCQSLLFIGIFLIDFQCNNLLYCPIVHKIDTIEISQWYMNQLVHFYPQWRLFHLKMSLFHKNEPKKAIVTSYLLDKEDDDEYNDQLDLDIHNPFNAEEIKKQKKLHKDLRTIRSFIYQIMIRKWIQLIIQAKDEYIMKIPVANNFEWQITSEYNLEKQFDNNFNLNSVRNNYQNDSPQNNQSNNQNSKNNNNNNNSFNNINNKINNNMNDINIDINNQQQEQQNIYRGEIISQLILFICEHKMKKNRQQIHTDLKSMIKGITFRYIAEKINYRTIDPYSPGSMSLYYYDKFSMKKKVQNFLNQF